MILLDTPGSGHTMRHYLVVANQTLGGEELDRTIMERIDPGDSWFHIVVPMTSREHETAAWSGSAFGGDMMTFPPPELVEQDARRRETARAEARLRAEERLEAMIDRVRAMGGEVDGDVGDEDPVTAVKDVLRDRSYDEIILSTLPAGLSRWLRMDLPSRVARMTDVPVTTVVAEETDLDA